MVLSHSEAKEMQNIPPSELMSSELGRLFFSLLQESKTALSSNQVRLHIHPCQWSLPAICVILGRAFFFWQKVRKVQSNSRIQPKTATQNKQSAWAERRRNRSRSFGRLSGREATKPAACNASQPSARNTNATASTSQIALTSFSSVVFNYCTIVVCSETPPTCDWVRQWRWQKLSP